MQVHISTASLADRGLGAGGNLQFCFAFKTGD
jgi:hypothetical protein